MTNPTMMLMMRYLRSAGPMRHTFGFSFSDWIGGGICAAAYMQVQRFEWLRGLGLGFKIGLRGFKTSGA